MNSHLHLSNNIGLSRSVLMLKMQGGGAEPGLISGIGVSIALFALVLSGISSLSGRLKYVSLVAIITTLSLFFISVESAS
jgi:hypothetical protein